MSEENLTPVKLNETEILDKITHVILLFMHPNETCNANFSLRLTLHLIDPIYCACYHCAIREPQSDPYVSVRYYQGNIVAF